MFPIIVCNSYHNFLPQIDPNCSTCNYNNFEPIYYSLSGFTAVFSHGFYDGNYKTQFWNYPNLVFNIFQFYCGCDKN